MCVIAGAWNLDGKGENIWDRFIHQNPSVIVDGSNADVACDSYHKYKEDIQLLKYLGVTHYRFSISWSRILPTGTNRELNLYDVKRYLNLEGSKYRDFKDILSYRLRSLLYIKKTTASFRQKD